MNRTSPGTVPDFLTDGGDAGARMRALGWSATPLGPPEAWPQPLRTLVGVMLRSHQPMFVAWGSARILLYNDGYAALCGARHPRALGRPFAETWHDLPEAAGRIMDRTFAGTPAHLDDIRFAVHRNGRREEVRFTVSCTPVRDETGAVAGAFGVCTETTGRMAAEAAPRDSEVKYRMLSEAMDEGYLLADVVSDADGQAADIRFLEANPAATRMLGRDCAGRRLNEVGGFDPHWHEILGRVARTGRSERLERYSRTLKTWFDFHVFKPGGRDSRQVAVVFEDVTERQRVEEELRRLNETLEQRVAEAIAERKLLADVVETTSAFIQVLDLDYRLLASNKANADEFERLYGVRPQVGDSLLDLLADKPAHLAQVKAMWDRALTGEEFTLVDEFGQTDDERRVYEIKFNVLRDRDGRQIGAYNFVYDVTDRQRDQTRLDAAEEQLLQAQKMETVGQLTGGVAHDFNNLLQALSGCLSMIGRRTREAEVRPLIEAGQQAVDRGAKLVQQLMAFARPESLRPQPIDVRERVNGMSELLARALRADIRLNTGFSAGLWPVEVDPTQFELALINLAVNARDAMPDGGELTIEASNLHLSMPDASGLTGDFVRLSVRDTGTGMPGDVAARVFEPFYTTKEVGKGSGLGLSQVYGFARQAGGTARIVSVPGRGTEVTMLLRRSSQPAMVQETAGPALAQARRRGSMLLVEDDEVVATTVAAALEDAGYAVAWVATADEALSLLAGGTPFDLVFSDVVMPGRLSGLDLVQAARQLRPDMPVVLTTGYSEKLADAEGVHVLAKPYRIDDLVRALDTAMEAAGA